MKKEMKVFKFYEFKEALKDVRRLLVTISMDRSGKMLHELEPELIETTRVIDDTIAQVLDKDSQAKDEVRAAVLEIKSIWEAFRKTRDEEILPALHEGRFDDATKLATGIQEERYRKFISIAELVNLSKDLEASVRQRTKIIRDNLFAFVNVFTDLMELFDPFIGGHLRRVSGMVGELAEERGLKKSDIAVTVAASRLHTIGLIGVPRVVFYKDESRLGERDRALLRQSPVLAQGLLSSIETLKQAGLIIRGHAEKYDGTGYPDGFKKDGIHIGSRIIAVCKFYDLLRHRNERPLSRSKAIELLKEERGKALDPELVNSFVELMEGRTEDKFVHRVHMADLKSDMVLAADLVTARGLLVVQKGTRVTSEFLDKIVEIDKIDPIVTAILIVSDDSAT